MPRRSLAAGLLSLAAIAVGGPPTPAAIAASPNGKLEISAVSSKPELVTGGDVLLAVNASRGAKPSQVKIRRNGSDVTSAFSPSPSNPNRLVGLVSGLRAGDNLITAYGPKVRKPASLSLFDSSIKGPIFSGPHQTPFICRTADEGLGAPTDADCSAPTQVSYFYRANDNTFKPLANPTGPYPADGVQTTTRDGNAVNYVVRSEKGVINRSIYRFNVLAPGGKPADGWNHRFVFNFGGGCAAGYQQGSQGSGPGLMEDELSEGYATLTGSLNVLGTACNDVLSAESAQMLKEHAIEELGQAPVWTMGEGSSGGSVQQQMIAQNYPGILDGIMPGASFADGAAPDYPDCRLLNNYFAGAGSSLTDVQRKAITGLVNANGCVALSAGADVVHASEGCDETVVPISEIFNPLTNPDGIRCTVWDSMVNIYGRDPQTGYARRTLDNVGVQYGLDALKSGDLSVDEFVALNQGVGGFDNNGDTQAGRSVADPQALESAYRSGRVNFTAGGYTDIPVLDTRAYVDDQVNVHQYVNTYRTRARLDATDGDHDNQVMWRADGGSSVKAMNSAALDTLGGWMDAIASDHSDKTKSEKVVADKPGDAVDACWIGGVRHDGVAAIGASNVCETTYPPHSLPATRAGRPLDSFVLKCQLKPIDYADYGSASFNATQKSALAEAFPNGVCDWSKPGVKQTSIDGTWQEFGPKRVIPKRDRKLSLKVKHRGSGKSRKLKLKASMRPCPETRFQEISFEQKGHGRHAHWRKFDSGVADGGECEAGASLKVGNGKGPAKLRARAETIANYESVSSKARTP